MKYKPIVKCPECGRTQYISHQFAEKIILNGMHKVYLKTSCKYCENSFVINKNLSFIKDQEENDEI